MLAYLWTCSHRKIEGLFELPLGYIASDLNIPIVVVEEKIKLLEEKGFVAYEDEVIFIKGYMSVQNKLQGKVPADNHQGHYKQPETASAFKEIVDALGQ
ncbi:MAG TPA: hypothetical protein PKY47_04955 [Acetomicrobium sp.]|nr:hypothetical protein [Acetomicrobium sp.]HQA36699.1 hypothetical protein [Acetomicrobium sp.]